MNKYRVIINPKLARFLIKEGYTVTDIKPHKSLENGTVFVFEVDSKFWKMVSDWEARSEYVKVNQSR